jgi:hypothetical protein
MSSWWTSTQEGIVRPGRLIWAYVPHVDQHPFVLVPEGRTDPEDHSSADYRFQTFKIKNPPPAARLPVAGLPHFQDEVRLVYRAKRRPLLILSGSGSPVDPALRFGAARHQTNPTILAAPYYSCESRWNRAFVERIMRCAYSQYMFDILPIPSGRESILRLNHVQPIGAHSEAYELTGYCLSAPALAVVEQQFRWFRQGALEKATELFEIRTTLLEDS